MRALVTGAAGFIGAHLASALVRGGADVRGFDAHAPTAGTLPDAVELVIGDLLDPDALRRAVDGCEAVFHLAAVYSYARRDRALMEAVNVRGTRALLDAALRGSRRRIVHTSSCATCGPVPGRSATERDHPCARDLRVPYRRTKLDGERLALRAAGEGAEVLVVNPTVPVGPGDRRPTPTGKMVADVAHGRARAYLSRSALNVVAVEDVAAGHLAALDRGRPGERYLLGGENIAVRDVFAVIAGAVGRPAPRLPVPWGAAYAAACAADALLRPLGREPGLLVPDEVRGGRLPHLFDDSKARSELGYVSRPAVDALASAARATVAGSETWASCRYRWPMQDAPLIVQLPRGGELERELRADPLPSVISGAVVLEVLDADEGGAIEAPDVGQVVLSLPSPEALPREAETVRRVVGDAGTGDQPLVVEVEVAEHLREEELAALLDAIERAPRPVILRAMRDA